MVVLYLVVYSVSSRIPQEHGGTYRIDTRNAVFAFLPLGGIFVFELEKENEGTTTYCGSPPILPYCPRHATRTDAQRHFPESGWLPPDSEHPVIRPLRALKSVCNEFDDIHAHIVAHRRICVKLKKELDRRWFWCIMTLPSEDSRRKRLEIDKNGVCGGKPGRFWPHSRFSSYLA